MRLGSRYVRRRRFILSTDAVKTDASTDSLGGQSPGTQNNDPPFFGKAYNNRAVEKNVFLPPPHPDVLFSKQKVRVSCTNIYELRVPSIHVGTYVYV